MTDATKSATPRREPPPDDGRMKLAVFDLDGTITRRDSFVAFLWSWFKSHPGRWPHTPRLVAMAGVHKFGWRDNSWLKQRYLHVILGGVDRERIAAHTATFLDGWLDRNVRPGAREELRRQREQGSRLVLLTASIDVYAEEIGRRLGFDAVIATKVAWSSEGTLTGELASANCERAEKVTRLEQYLAEEVDRPREGIFATAYGDDVKDVPILDWADVGVAVGRRPKLHALAASKGYAIEQW
ncbi:MAG: HAD-IB family hydrolase [Planctomycetales bacterium]|nr:HAD-IB family hydrolase [Planctomycetales bacterium]